MKLADFAYNLPKNLIAQKPIRPRDQSRLLVLDRRTGKIKHQHFYDIVNYLNKGEVLVVNNTKVMPARLIGKKAGTGGKVEVFLLKKIIPRPHGQGGILDCSSVQTSAQKKKTGCLRGNDKSNLLKGDGEVWQCLIGGKKRKENLQIEFAKGLKAEVIKNNLDGTWNVKFNKSGATLMKTVEKIGRVPLPPYVKRNLTSRFQPDAKNYQTVYADDTKLGSVAAPTAGFHFTPALLKKLKNKGVQIEFVTLRVGLGTFAPVKIDDITKHKMHAEWIEVSKKTLARIVEAKLEGRRIVAVGTTSVRVLETIANKFFLLLPSEAKQEISKIPLTPFVKGGQKELRVTSYGLRDYQGLTDIFIYPGYKFKMVDAMITNFHLPKSTLLMLVCAFSDLGKIKKAYREAIRKKYRFYSYGDAMLII